MTDTLARYAIGLVIGFALGGLVVWKMAHDSADLVLSDWERAVEAQRDAEKKRTDKVTEDIRNGLAHANADLRRRLLAGWRPAIPAAAGLSSGGVSQTPTGTDETASAGVPCSAGIAVERLAICEAQRERLIADGQADYLQCVGLMRWNRDVGGRR